MCKSFRFQIETHEIKILLQYAYVPEKYSRNKNLKYNEIAHYYVHRQI